MIHAEVTIFCHDDKAMSVQILWGDRAILYTYDHNHVFSSRGPLDQTSPRKARQEHRPHPLVPRGRGDFRLEEENEGQGEAN